MGISSALQNHSKHEMGICMSYLLCNWHKLILKCILLTWEGQSNAIYCFFCLNYSQKDHFYLNKSNLKKSNVAQLKISSK